ncbi:hypothetical protein PUN4_680035 [Paraburkholderia unamae]|nr:hypothetical protein PUN4_680035 [Paraburkholderia unamae]
MLGVRVGQIGIGLLDVGHHAVRAVQDPHGLAAPRHGHHRAGLEIRDVDSDRRAGGAGFFGWCKGTYEGYDSGHASNATCYGRRNQPGSAAAVDAVILFVSHHIAPLLSWIYPSRQLTRGAAER